MARSGNQHSTAPVAVLAVLLCMLACGCCADDIADDSSVNNVYYEEYGYYSEYDAVAICTVDEAGNVKLADTAAAYGCNIMVEGVDKQAGLLTGGIDGVYKLYSCQDGRPAYLRQNSPKGEERVFWYSLLSGEWDISRGPEPDEANVLMYGVDLELHPVPLFVKDWYLGADFKSATEATVKCADGKVYTPPVATPSEQKPVQSPKTPEQPTA